MDLQHHHDLQQPRLSPAQKSTAGLLGADLQHLEQPGVTGAERHDRAHHQLAEEGYAARQRVVAGPLHQAGRQAEGRRPARRVGAYHHQQHHDCVDLGQPVCDRLSGRNQFITGHQCILEELVWGYQF